MGRTPITRKEYMVERQLSYSKRNKSLLKKAYELAVLCDIDVSLIMYSPTNALRHFSTAPNMEKVLQRFVQQLPNMPEEERQKFQVSEDTINKIKFAADQQGPVLAEREEKDKEIRDHDNKLVLLQEQERMLYPPMGTLNSLLAFEERKRCLGIYLDKIIGRQEQLLMQQQQAVAETRNWGPPQGGGQQLQLQQQGVAVDGTKKQSSTSVQPLLVSDALPLLPHPLFTAEQEVVVPAAMPNPVIPEVAGLHRTCDFQQQQQPYGQTSDYTQVPLHLGDQKQEMQHGVAFFGSEQTTMSPPPFASGDPSVEDYNALWAPYTDDLLPIGPNLDNSTTSDNTQVPLHLGDQKQEMQHGVAFFGSEQTTMSPPPFASGDPSVEDYNALWAPYTDDLLPIGPNLDNSTTSDNTQVPLHLGDQKQEMQHGVAFFGSEQTTMSRTPFASGNPSVEDYNALWAPYTNDLLPIGPNLDNSTTFDPVGMHGSFSGF